MAIGNPSAEGVFRPADGAEKSKLEGVTAGTVSSSKALVADSNKDLSALRYLTLDGFIFNDIDAVAAAGSAQNDAAELTGVVNVVSAADGTKGVILPAAAAGLVRIV